MSDRPCQRCATEQEIADHLGIDEWDYRVALVQFGAIARDHAEDCAVLAEIRAWAREARRAVAPLSLATVH